MSKYMVVHKGYDEELSEYSIGKGIRITIIDDNSNSNFKDLKSRITEHSVYVGDINEELKGLTYGDEERLIRHIFNSNDPQERYDYDMVQQGWLFPLTEENVLDIEGFRERHNERARATLKADEQKQQEAEERKEYERLKKKYG